MGADVVARVRRDDPVAYLRTVAMLVRGLPNADVVEPPLTHLSMDELRDEYVAAFCDLFPDLRIVRRPALIEKQKDR